MNPVKVIVRLIKTILPIAGVIFLVSRLLESKKNDRYRFTTDSALKNEYNKLKIAVPSKKYSIKELQKLYFNSMDN
jgi:hypothetical protein